MKCSLSIYSNDDDMVSTNVINAVLVSSDPSLDRASTNEDNMVHLLWNNVVLHFNFDQENIGDLFLDNTFL